MEEATAARTSPRRSLGPAVAVLVVVILAALGGPAVHQSASPSAPSSSEVHRPGHGVATTTADGPVPDAPIVPAPPGMARAATTTEADGALPNGVTVFDDRYPGVANLDADLLRATRAAAADAAGDGVAFHVNSGWRSPAYQEQLLREALAQYGSQAEAARWVAAPDTSAHVTGDAIDIGPSDAAAWLSEHGAAYGLCRIYDNEPWHYELRPQAIDRGCPSTFPDPTHDPRMQQ